MRDYDEVTNTVLKRRDELIARDKHRMYVIRKSAAAALSMCLVTAVGIGIWKNQDLRASLDNQYSSNVITTTQVVTEQATKAVSTNITSMNTEKKSDRKTISVVSYKSDTVTQAVTASNNNSKVSDNSKLNATASANGSDTVSPYISPNTAVNNSNNTEAVQTTATTSEPAEIESERSIIMKKLASFLTALSLGTITLPNANALQQPAMKAIEGLDKFGYTDMQIEHEDLTDKIKMYNIIKNDESVLDFNNDGKFDLLDPFMSFIYENNNKNSTLFKECYEREWGFDHFIQDNYDLSYYIQSDAIVYYMLKNGIKYEYITPEYYINNYSTMLSDEGFSEDEIASVCEKFAYEVIRYSHNLPNTYTIFEDLNSKGIINLDIDGDGALTVTDLHMFKTYYEYEEYPRIGADQRLPSYCWLTDPKLILSEDSYINCQLLYTDMLNILSYNTEILWNIFDEEKELCRQLAEKYGYNNLFNEELGNTSCYTIHDYEFALFKVSYRIYTDFLFKENKELDDEIYDQICIYRDTTDRAIQNKLLLDQFGGKNISDSDKATEDFINLYYPQIIFKNQPVLPEYTDPAYYEEILKGSDGTGTVNMINYYKRSIGLLERNVNLSICDYDKLEKDYTEYLKSVVQGESPLPDVNGDGLITANYCFNCIEYDDYDNDGISDFSDDEYCLYEYRDCLENNNGNYIPHNFLYLSENIFNKIKNNFDLNNDGVSGDIYDIEIALWFIDVISDEIGIVDFNPFRDICDSYDIYPDNADWNYTEYYLNVEKFNQVMGIETENRSGDANCDGETGLADALLILQNNANSNKYQLTNTGEFNADVCNTGDGVTPMDALEIQKWDAQKKIDI